MAVEIERKFLVQGQPWLDQPCTAVHLRQGYLNRDKARTTRIRIAGDKAFLTIKGETRGTRRLEFEYAIPMEDAEQLLALCEGPIIDKHRHVIEHAGMRWEVDQFHGDNQGLVIAEIELESENQHFDTPSWLGEEVSHDPRYFNANLSNHPFLLWTN